MINSKKNKYKKKLNCLIFIDADVIARHFLFSDTFSKLILKHNVRFVFPNQNHKRVNSLDFKKLKKFKINFIDHDQKRLSLWRRILFVDQMRFKLGYQNNSVRNLRIKTNNWKQSLIYFLYGLPIIWQIFQNRIINILKNSLHIGITEQFDKFKPDVVIHPSVLEGLFINDLILNCEIKKIPLIVIMNSWDNPSTKRAVIGKPNYLLVWGEQTFQHSLKYLGDRKSVV